jgi:hypothetical protein
MTEKEEVIGVFVPDDDYTNYERETKGIPKSVLNAIAQLSIMEAFENLPSYVENESKYHHHEKNSYIDLEIQKFYAFIQKKLGTKFRCCVNVIANTKFKNLAGANFEKVREVNKRFAEWKEKNGIKIP